MRQHAVFFQGRDVGLIGALIEVLQALGLLAAVNVHGARCGVFEQGKIVPLDRAGRGFVEDLRPEIVSIAPRLGQELTRRLIGLMPAERIESYGKAAAVGTAGEIEHASAMIHTLRFGNVLRDAVGGTTYLEFCNTRNAPGALLSLPMMHKSENGRRSHFITANFQIADGPAADEIVVAIGAADGGRVHPRIADRFQDMKEM